MSEFVYSNAGLLAEKYRLKSEEMPALTREVARDVGDYIVAAARTAAPKRTGRLTRSISRSGVRRTGPDTWVVDVGSKLPRAKFTEYGTGLYDPGNPHLIYPVHAKVMSWVEKGPFATAYKGAGIYHSKAGKNRFNIFSEYTRGQPGQHFFELAVDSADTIYIPGRLHELGIRITH